MRRLIEYFNSLFCKHEFEYEFEYEEKRVETSSEDGTKDGTKIYRICHKCGYHNNYWKFQ